MEKQYATWWESGSSNPETVFWYNLIYMTQFKSLRRYRQKGWTMVKGFFK
jgi:hypothetical protein